MTEIKPKYGNEMTVSEYKKEMKKHVRRGNPESELQQSCVSWFRREYPQYSTLFFKIANDGKRTIKTIKGKNVCVGGKRFKDEGGVAGVADMMLAIPGRFIDQIHGMFVEFKWGKNIQTPEQKNFQISVEQQGYAYILIYDFERFKEVINNYLK